MKMDFTGFEGIQKQLDEIEQKLRSGYAKQVLEAGAKEYVKTWENVTRKRGHVRSGDLAGSITVTDVRETGNGAWIATVKPDGYDRRHVANDLKMNVLGFNYDKSIKRVSESAAKIPAEEAMQKKLNELLGSKGN